MLQELFDSLSERSVYYRFFSPMRKLSSEMLIRFTQIDYDREIALVAVREMADNTNMLALGRRLGFSMKMVPRANAYKLSLQFTASAENASVLKQSG